MAHCWHEKGGRRPGSLGRWSLGAKRGVKGREEAAEARGKEKWKKFGEIRGRGVLEKEISEMFSLVNPRKDTGKLRFPCLSSALSSFANPLFCRAIAR